MTAVIYARYSSDNRREESIEGQIRECTAFTFTDRVGQAAQCPQNHAPCGHRAGRMLL